SEPRLFFPGAHRPRTLPRASVPVEHPLSAETSVLERPAARNGWFDLGTERNVLSPREKLTTRFNQGRAVVSPTQPGDIRILLRSMRTPQHRSTLPTPFGPPDPSSGSAALPSARAKAAKPSEFRRSPEARRRPRAGTQTGRASCRG